MGDVVNPARSSASGRQAAVTSSHVLASSAALTVLAQGGNAVDAAVTASFVLGVIEPNSTGIGGDCFALYLPKDATRPLGLNGSGATPAALDPGSAYAAGGAPLAETSVHAVTIPGCVDGLCQLLAQHGTWPLARALAPAIAFAENGFPVHARVAREWRAAAAKLAQNEAARAHLLVNGAAPAAGDVVRMPALASTLRKIAVDGPEAFYRGAVAAQLAQFLHNAGGFHMAEDFAHHRSETVVPITSSYRGYDLWQIPPSGQGATALMMLNILETFDIARLPFDGIERHHLTTEAARLAFIERNRVIADPRFGAVPLSGFLDKDITRRLATNIRSTAGQTTPASAMARGDTAYVAVVDEDRNAVSLISSLFEDFGSGLYEPETGVIFHNRGSGFSGLADHPNALAPGKRPLHTIIPGLMTRDGRPVMIFGVTGGPYQPTGHAQLVTGLVDHRLDIQDAIDRPRSFLLSGRLHLEPGLFGPTGDGLLALGHDVVPAERPIGGGHGIWIDSERGALLAGSDPRKDGKALAY